jgi:hypothetical protein
VQLRVSYPTYRDGGILDLEATSSDFNLHVDVNPPHLFSDNLIVTCRLSFASMPCLECGRLGRSNQRVNRLAFRQTIEGSARFGLPSDNADVDKLFATYDRVLRDIDDKMAPVHMVRRVQLMAPWFDSDYRSFRCQCR